MADIELSFPLIIDNEGGFTNDPYDHGGATNWGITQVEYEKFKGRSVSIDEMKSMPIEDAKAIYKLKYWDILKLDFVLSQKIATLMFDQGVNRGVSRAAKDMQELVNVQVDGVIGPKSLQAINNSSVIKLGLDFIKKAQISYVMIVRNNNSQLTFLLGWINRTHKLMSYLMGDS